MYILGLWIFCFIQSGDLGNNINLGRQFNSASNCLFPSGTEVEEESSNGNQYAFGTETYTYTFYDTATSGATTSVTGYYGPEGWGATVTLQQNSPAKTTFSK